MASYYDGLAFNTKLAATWAAFFDLAGWSWRTNPQSVNDWQPDFRVKFQCDHSECHGAHTLLITVLPLSNVESFRGHPCLTQGYWVEDANGRSWADGGAAFGLGPQVTQWDIVHGSGSGLEDIYFRVQDADRLWQQAEKLVNDRED